MNREEEHRQRIEAYLEGSLEQAQTDELFRAVEKDEDVARLLAEQTIEAELLAQALGQERALAGATEQAERLPSGLARGGALRYAGKDLSRSWRVGMTVAACLLLAFCVYLFSPGPKEGISRQTLAMVYALDPGLTIERFGNRFSVADSAPLCVGDVISTAPAGKARIAYPGETSSIELNGDTRIELREEAGAKRIFLHSGQAFLEVGRQPAGKPMRVNPGKSGEIAVLGTAFEVSVVEEETFLRMKSGTVQFGGARAIPVSGGQFSRVRAGRAPEAPRTLSSSWIGAWRKGVTVVNFGPAGLPLPEGVRNDSGEAFTPARGFGWKGPPGHGRTLKAQSGAPEQQAALAADPLRATAYCVGNLTPARTWSLVLPNGEYEVAFSCGYWFHPGRHRLRIEGAAVLDELVAQGPPYCVEKEGLRISVTDGELTLELGGLAGAPGASETPDDLRMDHALNFIVIRSEAQGR